jgi:cobalt-precorrin 5A hydrolase/precorrin-3B C17-methyltransferase
MTPAVVIFGQAGRSTAERIVAATGGTLHVLNSAGDARTLLPRLFEQRTPIVGVCASGILIRFLAGNLRDKQAEPPVLAVSQDGRAIVPLLGGHHGANELARTLATALEGVAAITTASETRFGRSLDDPPPGWTICDPVDAKPAMMALLAGARIALEGHAPWLSEAGYPISSLGAVKVLVTEQQIRIDHGVVYNPRTLVAGVGCERGAAAEEVIGLIDYALRSQNFAPASLCCIASIDLKADEPALHAAAAHFGVPLRLFEAAELSRERYRLVNPSAVVEAAVGTPGVAEAAALKAGPLVVSKLKSERATCAIARAPHPLDPERFGRRPGALHIVGIGPGAADMRTAAAVAALGVSTDWIGYGLYLDLVGDLHREQVEHRYQLGDEEVRVRKALELAAEGRVVSLICSGDAQIYAMAALVYELLAETGPRALPEVARRVGVAAHPGISAFQAASAAAGALIGHDFCCISLSDLLTPGDDIRRRLTAAAEGDFVTALYNPRSQRRTELIEEAHRIFLAHRPPGTPVVVASNLGRPGESVRVVELAAFDPTEIDMLSIVLIGSSTSRALQHAGRTLAFTPRGYAGKADRPAVAAIPADPPAPAMAPAPVPPFQRNYGAAASLAPQRTIAPHPGFARTERPGPVFRPRAPEREAGE